MKKTLSLSLAIAAILSAPTFASGDYNTEVSLSHEVGDYGEPNFRTSVISGEYHFDTVNTSNKPYAEAAFLDHSTFIDASISHTTGEMGGGDNDFALGGRLVTDSNIIIESAVQRVGNDNALSIAVGYHIVDNIDIVVSYQDFNDADAQTYTVNSHGVFSLSGTSFLSYDAGLAHTEQDGSNSLNTSAGVTYYFTRSIGLGLDYDHTSIDSSNSAIVSLTADYFVTPKIALSAKYSGYTQDAEGGAFQAEVSVRF